MKDTDNKRSFYELKCNLLVVDKARVYRLCGEKIIIEIEINVFFFSLLFSYILRVDVYHTWSLQTRRTHIKFRVEHLQRRQGSDVGIIDVSANIVLL
jgi:hypothetical protein